MPVVRLEDVFVREVYSSMITLPDPVKLAFINSGIAVAVPGMMDQLNSGAKFITMPFWNVLDADVVPNMSDDDPTRFAVPHKLNTGSMQARNAWMNNGWSQMDLTVALSGSSPLQEIRNQTSRYWDKRWQRRLLAACIGVMNENVANGDSDMVVDRSTTGTVSDANRFSKKTFMDAVFTLGDALGGITGIAVHSMTLRKMIDDDAITPPSQATFNMPTYMGKIVVVDDGMPIASNGAGGFVATSILFGRGALGFALGTHGIPVELERTPRAGNGAGQTTLWERKTVLVHPFGYDWKDNSLQARSVATPGFNGPELSPTDADLMKAANWERVYDRKVIPLAFLITNI